MRRAIVLACLAACTGRSEDKPQSEPQHPPIRIRLEVTEGSAAEQLAQKAVAVFEEECPKWREHWYDVKSAVARYRSFGEYDYPLETYGWKRAIEVEISLREGTSTFDQPVPGYAGHTFRYLLGGGPKPGIVTGKDGAKALCDIPAREQGDEIRAVPNLSFL